MSSDVKTQFYKSARNAGQTTAYRIYGDRASRSTSSGTPLVMIQGLSAVGTIDFHDLAQVLSKTRTVITLDNRGLGESVWKAATENGQMEPFTLEDLARDVVELIQHLGYGQIDILGHSMGGMITQTLITLENLPFQIQHCILGATCAKNPKSDLGRAMAAYLRKCSKEGKKPVPLEMTDVMMRKCYDPDWIQHNPELYERRVKEGTMSKRPAEVIALQQRAIGKYDVRSKLHQIPKSLPVLVIHGALDVAVYPEEADELFKCIPHAQSLGPPPGDFAHSWFDYFGPIFWQGRISRFLDKPMAKL